MSDKCCDKSWLVFGYVTVVLAALVMLVGVMSHRYEFVASNNPMYGYKLDKMTGKAFFVYRNREVPMQLEKIEEPTAPQPQQQPMPMP